MKVLFQGDSITDCSRGRNDDRHFGVGYPLLTKAALEFECPCKYEFVNRGISGNRIVDIYARLRCDIVNLAPDFMSLLIGVNDVWHDLHESPNGVDAERFFKVYCMLIEDLQKMLPDLKIMIMEPFVLKTGSTVESWDYFSTEVAKRAEMAKKVAEKYGLPFLPLQDGFNKLVEKAPENYWLSDGVHPTSAGHRYISECWIKKFRELGY